MGDDVHEYIEMALDTGFSHIDTGQCDFEFSQFQNQKFETYLLP